MTESVPAAADQGARRYTLERMLGSGGMGAVYLARDHETGEHVALKKLLDVDANSVLRLKREFRSVADLDHPNLIKLYDLELGSDGWMLTMEYVAGQDLLSYVQQLGAWVDRSKISASSFLNELQAPVNGRDATLPSLRPSDPLAAQRALSAFYQLACGVRALHRAGMLHRDLKPSNVLVAEHRVVVLDFGLVRELKKDRAPTLTEAGAIAGTPAYMAPEQARGPELSEATDWYAFGAMLYEALTGHLPFDGGLLEMLFRKLEDDPQPPRELNPEAPAALSEFCMALLRRDPAARPSGDEVVAWLKAEGARPAVSNRPDPASARPPISARSPNDSLQPSDSTFQTETQTATTAPFFGRGAEIAALWQALQLTHEDVSAVVHVRGASGAGKSALVEHFLDDVENADGGGLGPPGALVLRSRCYEREAMPFKALDGLMDALVRHLSHLDDLQVGHLLPADIEVLAQLFPVLERLRAVQKLLVLRNIAGEGVYNRRRAEAALRELIGRIAARRPLAIWIDDLQWGDLDSASLLRGWLQRPFDAPLLLVFSYRADEAETSPCLQLLLQAGDDAGHAAPHSVVIDVAALDGSDVTALCRERLGDHARAHPDLIVRIAAESQGSPFWASQLAALALAKIERGEDAHDISIEDVVSQTSALLPPEANALLAVLAVAGRPMVPKLALRAAGLRHGGRKLVHALRGLRLVRTRDAVGERLLEVYHDRVRESVQGALPASELERIHGDLLSALEHSGRADPDWLHALALGASLPVPALRYGLAAAERARATLAFERAAELYRRCLSLSAPDAPNRAELLRKLATVLGQSGKGAQAAEAQIEAAKLVGPDEAIALTCSAGSHLLRSGRFSEGEALLSSVLAAMDIDMPQSESGLTAAVVWEQLRLRMRGLGHTLRSAQEVPAAVLARIDLYELLRAALINTDALRSTLFQVRSLRMALEAGEPVRLARALASAAISAAVARSGDRVKRAEELLAMAERIAEHADVPAARAAVLSSRATAEFMLNRTWKVAEPSYEAERILRALANTSGDSSYAERLTVVIARIGSFHALGDFRRFLPELRATLEEARATDNRAALLQLALLETVADEIEARPAEAFARLVQQREQLPTDRFSILHLLHMASLSRIACRLQRFDWGVPLLENDFQGYLRSTLRHSASMRGVAHWARARLLLNHHVATGCEGDVAKLVATDIKMLSQLRTHSQAATLRARVAFLQGKRELAIQHMQAAFEDLSDGALVDANVHRHALGLLRADGEGAEICKASERALCESGVVEPLSYVRSFYPELFAR